MGITKAEHLAVQGERDDLTEKLRVVQQSNEAQLVIIERQAQTIRALYEEQDADSEEISNLYRKLDLLDEQAADAIYSLADAAAVEQTSLKDQITFLAQGLVSIIAYKGDNPEVVRGLAHATVSDFLPQ